MSKLRLVTSVIYLRRKYGIPARDLLKAWLAARGAEAKDDFWGFPRGPIEAMFLYAADRMYDECVTYRCVNGCCSVLWHPRRGNVGGAGPVGCGCDDLDEPRDLAFGPVGVVPVSEGANQ